VKYRALLFVLCALAVGEGCGKEPASQTVAANDSLTAVDLAELTDLHVWKIAVPAAQRPFTQVRLVVVKPDGAATQVFGTSTSPGGMEFSSILFGFRSDHGACTGKFHLSDSRGGGLSWNVNFTNPIPDSRLAWSQNGSGLFWNSNRVRLAETVDNQPIGLDLEVVK
jgi:hypothetical protein